MRCKWVGRDGVGGGPLSGPRERRGHRGGGAAGGAPSRRRIEAVVELRLPDQCGLGAPPPGLRGDELGTLYLGRRGRRR